MDLKDKVVFAGAIAATALAAAKLVADKESKISDFRKDWIASFRSALCTCLADAHVIAGRIRIRWEHAGRRPFTLDELEKLESELTEHWSSYRRSFQMTLLHLNFPETSILSQTDPTKIRDLSALWNDMSVSSPPRADQLLAAKRGHSVNLGHLKASSLPAVELINALASLRSMLLGAYSGVGIDERYNEIESLILRATFLGNLTIKPEWNRIKRGEKMHRAAIYLSLLIVAVASLKLLAS